MSCSECDDTGFVHQVGELKTSHGTFHNVEHVKRCERYTEYFQILLEALGVQTASRRIKMQRVSESRTAPGCGAAVQQHQQLRESFVRSKEPRP